MYELKTDTGKTLRIAENKREMVNSLFVPGGTADGCILRRNKRSVHLSIHNKEYCFNRYGVLFKKTRTGYTLCLDFGFMSTYKLAERLSVSSEFTTDCTVFTYR